METTLKEIGIGIAKGTIRLAKKIINAKITPRRIGFALLIIVICFIVYIVIVETFPPSRYKRPLYEMDIWQKSSYDMDIVDEWLEQQGRKDPPPTTFGQWIEEVWRKLREWPGKRLP